MGNETFLKSFVSGIESNFHMLKRLEEGKQGGKTDAEFLAYCRGGISACEKILVFVKDLNGNEK